MRKWFEKGDIDKSPNVEKNDSGRLGIRERVRNTSVLLTGYHLIAKNQGLS